MTIGVVIMAYGTPASPEEIEAYYTDIRRGRPPSPEQLADLRRRYEAIGGTSPLIVRTLAQVAEIRSGLDDKYLVELGTKHGTPRIAQAVDALASAGVTGLVGLVLAPHYSELSVGEYAQRVLESAAAHGLPARTILSWHTLPELIDALAARLTAAGFDDTTEVLFTAHSLPERILASGDPYPAQLEETARLVAAASGVERWRTGWQSAGRTPEPWLGPDLLEVIRHLPEEGRGVKRVVVCPAGFTSDHLEILYDVDIDARRVAAENGLELVRTASLNDDPAVCAALARLIAGEAAMLAPA
jgi:protoporphyrin/coproporphyrin ferrochelatase